MDLRLTRDQIVAYYSDPFVRERIREFLGATGGGDATCAYMTGESRSWSYPGFGPRPPSDLETCLDQGLEIGRSLWDHQSLLLHIDLEYVNFDFPCEAYLEPERTMALQRPVVHAVEEHLNRHGIRPIHLLTGRGHHFVWAVSRESRAYHELVTLGLCCTSTDESPHRGPIPGGATIEPSFEAAYSGVGRVLEYLGHRVVRSSADSCPLSVQLTEVEVGPGPRGREIVSFDISEYGDPPLFRSVRAPFSVYLKPDQHRDQLGGPFVDGLPTLFEVPLHEMDELQGLRARRDIDAIRDLAKRSPVGLADQSLGVESLIAEYRKSELFRIHEAHYSVAAHEPSEWPSTYDRAPMECLPPCTRHILEFPNDRLLKPAGLQLVVRSFLALGWHPRHIAGLIWSRYGRDHDWDEVWETHAARERADFYTRLFSGLFLCGRDDLVDFNCESNREKGYCVQTDCSRNLASYRDSARARRSHERLARRPFDRLFLSN